jgi:hypothetical protein
MTETSHTWRPRTWGLVLGLLTFSAAVLIGTAAGLEPETILHRSLVGSAVAAGVVMCTAVCVQVAAAPAEED